MYKLMAAPVVKGLGKLNTAVGMEDFDDDELDAGKLAIGAMIYENGGRLSAEILLVMWITGVYPHRIAKRVMQEPKKKVPRELAPGEEKAA